ncbi:hypothetical protein [Aliiroseovarius sp. PTFE2010]|uniref:hypothetical protein n=1 Tax=Aliiroseovarius sp. PTFE2010 TaxID=3417190 RepID=UPI003CE8CC8E
MVNRLVAAARRRGPRGAGPRCTGHRVRAAVLAALVGASPAVAQQVSDCDWRARADNIMEPWEENTRTFGGGRTRITALDTIEPAVGAFHLMIVSPPFDEVGARQCKIVSLDGSAGFAGMHIDRMIAGYHPSTGLALQVPVRILGETGAPQDAVLNVAVNQGTGAISAQVGAP